MYIYAGNFWKECRSFFENINRRAENGKNLRQKNGRNLFRSLTRTSPNSVCDCEEVDVDEVDDDDDDDDDGDDCDDDDDMIKP
jgi:hypothetical protein